MSTSATSGRENSTGGSSPLASSSRTFVPERKTWSSPPCGHVVGLRLADERVDQETVDGLEGDLRQVLVRAVDRVAGLEADHPPPAALGERTAGVDRVERELGKRRPEALEDRHATREIERLLPVEVGNTRVRLFGRAEAALGLPL